MTTRRQLTCLIKRLWAGEASKEDIARVLNDYWDTMENLDFALDKIDEQVTELRRIIKE